MKTTSEKINAVCTISAVLLFASSFFVVDNRKAVNRRWISLGLVAAGWGVEVIAKQSIKLSK